ncbi:MAG TPA: ABC transporter permease [Candidatus Limnocylindrales bacterium]|nr:ABC transporter permease [Candidatus Limnocylindrales bacterium]
MRAIVDDLRYALRGLAKNPGFAVVAVISLALGIGANTTIFTLVNGILLRPMPVSGPSRLVSLKIVDSATPGEWGCSYPNYKDYRDRNTVFSSLLAYSPLRVNMTGRSEPQPLIAQIVSGNYFETLGVTPVIGRGFLPQEDGAPGAHQVAVISHSLWTREYGGDPHLEGRTILLDNRLYRIVGVAPEGFQGVNSLYAADAWLPMAMYPVFSSIAQLTTQRRYLGFFVIGRLKTGVTDAAAQSAMDALSLDLEREYPRDNDGRRVRLVNLSQDAIAGRTRGAIVNAGTVLMIVSGLVLLIACANVANLLIVKAAGRNREIAIRLAMGAGRWALIRQLLVESLLLAIAGCAIGLAMARWSRDALWTLRPPVFKYAGFRLDLDGRVLFYTVAICFATAILFGLLPALRATAVNLATDLKDRAGNAASARAQGSARSILVIFQVALSMIALIGAGLFIRSLFNADTFDPGFDAAHLGVVSFDLSGRYDQNSGTEYIRRSMELAAGVPGVTAVSIAKDQPFEVASARTVLLSGDTAGAKGRITLTSVVWPGFFQTVGTPLRQGRDFTHFDGKAEPHVAIVNEAAAAHFWPGENAVGKTLNFFGDSLPAQVIGVARNANYQAVMEAPQAMIYLCGHQYYFPYGALFIRTKGDPDGALSEVRRGMRALDRNLLLTAKPVHAMIRESLWSQRLSADLLAVFGMLALVLAMVGMYGVISYSVQQRTREIGVRLALGATPADVRAMVLGQGVKLVTLGVITGTAAALVVTRMVASMLFVSPRDALTFVLVPAVLLLVGLAACWVPSLRATRIDPSVALRDE